MSETLDPSLSGLNDCGCCAGITAETPATVLNREGLDQIQYRVGAHGPFKRTLLAALSEAKRPKLLRLTTRADDDFSIALLDAWAVTADVLTFYQERLANESYLRTATDHGTVLRLARLIGYELKPGAAATVWLAFTLETAPGSPEKATIAAGAKVQSVPGQDEKPQTFETVEDIEARLEWNAMRPQRFEPPDISAGVKQLYLRGTATQLQPGDAILIVGDERTNSTIYPDRERWDVRELLSVTVNPLERQNWTRVTWEDPLGKAPIPPAAKDVRVYAFRQRAALFGHNAPDPRILTLPAGAPADASEWKDFKITGGLIDLDVSYPRIVGDSWVALVKPPVAPDARNYVELYKVQHVSHPSRKDYGLSGKVTRIEPDTPDHLDNNFFPLRDTLVFAQSEELEVACAPLTTRPASSPSKLIALGADTLAPVEGNQVTLDREVSALDNGRTLIVSGRRIRVKVSIRAAPLQLTADNGVQSTPLKPGESLVALAPPAIQSGNKVMWRLRREDGLEGAVLADLSDFILTPAADTDESISEVVTVASASGTPTKIVLNNEGLTHSFDRATVAIAGNVARATHGETVEEFAGSGDATQVFQKFTLRQSPLTFVRAGTSSGLTSTLEVRVDDLLWHKVPFLYARRPEERIYVERPGDGEKTTIHFGDGITGARLPSGQQNVRLKYRKGSGLEGLVQAGQLTQLLTRPLGVKEATNPLPAEGADEAESLSDARQNAPLTVLTLERVVSLQDYQDFSRAYPGIAKASNLLHAVRAAGDPFVPLRVESFHRALFQVKGTVTVHPVYEKEKVLRAAREALRSRFSFAARAFGQPVLLSEVIGVLHSVRGVVAVDMDHLQRTDKTEPENPAPRLLAAFPAGGAAADVEVAELLLLAPGNLEEIKAAS